MRDRPTDPIASALSIILFVSLFLFFLMEGI
jgi:hypothetical protein